MAIHENIDLNFNVKDKGQKALQGLAGAANKIGGAFSRVAGTLATFGGLAGAFGLAATVHGLDATYKNVQRIKLMTGAAAEEAHAVVDAFDLLGVSGDTTETIILRLSNKVRNMETGLQGGAKQLASMGAQWKRLGVDPSKGISSMVLDMSKAAKDGKLAIGDMQALFGIGRQQAVDTMKVLEHGPEHLKSLMNATLQGGDLITEQALAEFERMEQAKRDMADSWQELAGTVYKTLMPAISRIFVIISDSVAKWAPAANRFGELLTNHMETIVGLAKTFAKVMLLNKGLSMVGAGGIGGAAKGLFSFASGKTNLGGLLGLGGAGQAIGGLMKFLQGAVALRPIVMGLMRLSVVGFIFVVIAKAFSLLVNDVDGVRTRMSRILHEISARFENITHVLSPLLDVLGTVFLGAATAVLWVVEAILEIVNVILKVVAAIGIFLADAVMNPIKVMRHPVDAMANAWREADVQLRESMQSDAIEEARRRAKAPTPDARQAAQNNFDFRGSRFDIKNEFAEGFDPDRVAVAFVNDIAALGERQLQSSFSPLFSVR